VNALGYARLDPARGKQPAAAMRLATLAATPGCDSLLRVLRASTGCDSLLRVLRASTDKRNFYAFKDIRHTVSEITITKSGSKFAVSIHSLDKKDMQIIFCDEESRSRTVTNDAKEWSSIVSITKGPTASVPGSFKEALHETFQLLLAKQQTKLLAIREQLLEILIKILTKYERHEKIIFGDMQNETVSFLNSLTPTNLGRLIMHFTTLEYVPPSFMFQSTFDKWTANDKITNYRIISDDP
ncbi:hypothetical protein PRIPAC_96898, partial [Pristionchus pacificus]|uniref:Uncharacterized protein n=1 Tax=Pristionchus pacificus TaxID=54126 RepID=A0A2A6CU24_PRIPA